MFKIRALGEASIGEYARDGWVGRHGFTTRAAFYGLFAFLSIISDPCVAAKSRFMHLIPIDQCQNTHVQISV